MKKLVLFVAVIASVSLFSCTGTQTTSTSADTTATVEDTTAVVDSAATDTAAKVEAPAEVKEDDTTAAK